MGAQGCDCLAAQSKTDEGKTYGADLPKPSVTPTNYPEDLFP